MRAHQQIALPMPRNGAILDRRGTLRDRDHVHDPPPPLDAALCAALGPPCAQTRGQLPAQLPPRLHIQRLIDRLVTDPHLHIIGIVSPQSGRNLLRRPAPPQPRLHLSQQPRAARQLPQLRATRPLPRQHLRAHRPIALTPPTPSDLPRHRRRGTPQRPRDRPPRLTRRQPPTDPLALTPRQPMRRMRDPPTRQPRPIPNPRHRRRRHTKPRPHLLQREPLTHQHHDPLTLNRPQHTQTPTPTTTTTHHNPSRSTHTQSVASTE